MTSNVARLSQTGKKKPLSADGAVGTVAEQNAVSGNRFVLERRPAVGLADIAEAWDDLARRALERNIFTERAFALTAAQHIASEQHMGAVLVWRSSRKAPGDLLGLFLANGRRIDVPGVSRLWHMPFCGLDTPLIDAENALDVAGAFLDHMAKRAALAGGVMFPLLPVEGAVAKTFAASAEARGLATQLFDRHERAVLNGGHDPETFLTSALPGKKLKELRRQLRRLDELGAVRVETLVEPQAVRDATEVFLALEASGWKAQRGTALLQSEGTATFVRTMTRLLASKGRCRVITLRSGDKPIAAGVLLDAGSHSWFWKIAYDEQFARFSPGVQLTLALTRYQLERKTVERTDSCAIAGHPMIDHLWPERMAVADLFIGLRPGGHGLPAAVIRLERLRRNLRGAAKHVYYRLKGY